MSFFKKLSEKFDDLNIGGDDSKRKEEQQYSGMELAILAYTKP